MWTCSDLLTNCMSCLWFRILSLHWNLSLCCRWKQKYFAQDAFTSQLLWLPSTFGFCQLLQHWHTYSWIINFPEGWCTSELHLKIWLRLEDLFFMQMLKKKGVDDNKYFIHQDMTSLGSWGQVKIRWTVSRCLSAWLINWIKEKVRKEEIQAFKISAYVLQTHLNHALNLPMLCVLSESQKKYLTSAIRNPTL